jgi:signal transduction histidine kinase/HAMP domain-containing protein
MAHRFSIRWKLLVWLTVAGFVPLVVASTVSLRIIRSRLDDSIRKETDRSLRIGLNLIIDQVQRVGSDAARLGEEPDLRRLLARYDAGEVRAADAFRLQAGPIVDRYRGRFGAAELALLDRRDKLLLRDWIGAEASRRPLPAKAGKPEEEGARLRPASQNFYLRTVDLVIADRTLVIRALAPVVDENYDVLGTLVLSVPLDQGFAESVHATLGVHLGFALAKGGGASSLAHEEASTRVIPVLPATLMRRVLAGETRTGLAAFGGRPHSQGLLPLLDSAQQPLGLFYVALDRRTLEAGKRQAYRSLLMGGGGVFLLAFLIASIAAQGLSRPLTQLHRRAMAVARGDLEGKIDLRRSDELGELGDAFDDMTEALRENQRRLAARINEIVTLHQIGRGVSAALGMDPVLRTTVKEIQNALSATTVDVLLVDEGGPLRWRASVGPADPPTEAHERGARGLAAAVMADGQTRCLDALAEHPDLGLLAQEGGLAGSVMAVPLEHQQRVLGVLVISRQPPAAVFGEQDLRLVTTLADQATTAIENARLYETVTQFNERLELMVAERTAELTRQSTDLTRALAELQEAQAQLVLSERLAGLGQLVAGIAHEVNTPASAILGAADNLDRNLRHLLDYARQFASLHLTATQWNAFMDVVGHHVERAGLAPEATPTEARQHAKDLAASLEAQGIPDARRIARRLVDLGAGESVVRLLEITPASSIMPLTGCLQELLALRRNASAIGTAIGTINRIVSALRAYSHLDQTRVDRMNLHDGIETTLVILGSRIKHGVTVHRRFGDLPAVPVYVDELNQVWTNLIVNAVDAMGEKGELTLETEAVGAEVIVRVTDSGPGIPPEILPRIFKPFFTTKAKGAGTGLGLGIVRRIVEKHGGRIEADSQPGRTTFTVRLPVAGPPALAAEPPGGTP